MCSWIGAFKDRDAGIEGAPGPMIIHADKSKTQEMEAAERERQRNGEAPSEFTCSEKFLEGITEKELKVVTSRNGSMTQETFVEWTRWFVENLSEGHGPCILFLDGHGSRWNVEALQYLIDNKVYPFFLASHTSIWAQPNDAGVNKRLHWAIECIVSNLRRTLTTTPNVKYFNEALSDAWKKFREAERTEFLVHKTNTTRSSYERTGIAPLNPDAELWNFAINTLGILEKETRTAYECLLKPNFPQLTPAEKKELRQNFEHSTYERMEDSEIALLISATILGKWRGKIEKGVSEGNEFNTYAKSILPENCGDTEAEKIALKFVSFIECSLDFVKLPKKLTKEEKIEQYTKQLINQTATANPIQIERFNFDKDCWEEGSATKRKGGIWKVFIGDDEYEANNDDIADSTKYLVKKAFLNVDDDLDRFRRRARKVRAQEAREKEKEIEQTAYQRKQERNRLLNDAMLEKVKAGTWTLDDFLELEGKLLAPFETEIDGRNVCVRGKDVSVMMQKQAIDYVMQNTVLSGSKRNGEDSSGEPKKKRRRQATTDTTYGSVGLVAIHSSQQRNIRDIEKAKAKEKSSLKTEQSNISKALEMVSERKRRCERQQRLRDEMSNRSGAGVGGSQAVTPVEIHVESYWAVSERSCHDDMRMVLRLFDPKCGKISKSKDCQWRHIEDTKLHQLSQNTFDLTVDKLSNRLNEVDSLLSSMDNEEDPNESRTDDQS